MAMRNCRTAWTTPSVTLVQDALDQADGHKGRAAEILGISRHALKRRLQRLGLQ